MHSIPIRRNSNVTNHVPFILCNVALAVCFTLVYDYIFWIRKTGAQLSYLRILDKACGVENQLAVFVGILLICLTRSSISDGIAAPLRVSFRMR